MPWPMRAGVFGIARTMRSVPSARDIASLRIPAITLTCSAARPCYATGAADYLTKPFDPWVLRAKVSVFLDLHRKNQQLERLLARH